MVDMEGLVLVDTEEMGMVDTEDMVLVDSEDMVLVKVVTEVTQSKPMYFINSPLLDVLISKCQLG